MQPLHCHRHHQIKWTLLTQGQWRHLMMSSSSLDYVAFGISTPTYVQIVATLYDYASGCDPAGQGPHCWTILAAVWKVLSTVSQEKLQML